MGARCAKISIQYASKIKSPNIVLNLVHLKKDRTDASVYQQLFIEIRDRYRDYIPVFTDCSRNGNSVACATVLPSDTVTPMRLPDSASIFTSDVCVINKALEEIKDSVASKYIIITDSLSCLQSLHYLKLEHSLDWDGDMKVRLFKFCQ